jgi:hypothetical protein
MRLRFLALVATLAAACGTKPKTKAPPPTPISTPPNTLRSKLGVDFTTAIALVIAPAASTSRDVTSAGQQAASNHLFAINGDDTLSALSVVVGADTATLAASVQLQALFDTPQLTLFQYTGVVADPTHPCGLVAARKSDSALFCIDGTPQAAGGKLGDSAASGNPIIYAGTGGIFSLDLSVPATPLTTKVIDSAIDGQVDAWTLNSDGDILAQVHNAARVYVGGTIYTVGSNPLLCMSSGPGANSHNFYYVVDDTTTPGTPLYALHKLTKSGNSFQDTVVFSDTTQKVLPACDFIAKSNAGLYFAGRLPGGTADYNAFTEFIDGSNPARKTVPDVAKVVGISGFAGGIIVHGHDAQGSSALSRYASGAGTFVPVLTAGQFTVGALAVSPAGEVTLSGRRVADGGLVVANVSPIALTIVDQSFTGDVLQITRIN